MFLVSTVIALMAIAATSALIVNDTDPSIQDICSLLPPNKKILRPHTCNNWVKCPSLADSTDFDEGTCVLGLYYSKDDSRCNFEDDVQCPYTAKIKNRCESRKDGTFLQDPESKDCHGYAYCNNGHEYKATCPSDLIFDPKMASCVYSQDYTCPISDKKEHDSPICRSIQNHMHFANEEDCTLYYECTNEGLLSHECDLEKAFDYVMGRCVPKESVTCHPKARKPLPNSKICGGDTSPIVGYVSDPESCSGFYLCSKQADNKPDRHPKQMHCDKGYFFDESSWSCRDRLNVVCPLDRCEGMDNKYVNVIGDCTAYARCSNGVTVAKGHCTTNYFFDERTQGCTPQNINYVACASRNNSSTQ